ncbi:ATP-binding protein [Acutalibacter caecimuris]|uniref:ATP-binding protein n=1 Tax=Acutalibacter caecimuris TaxID=3093657 RepID=UPI002AC96308|nr:ATP-binding protein [Acutalibacter sp. M00118]
MTGYEKLLQHAAEQAEGLYQPQDEDYVGPDGLLYCGKCHTRKQHRVLVGGEERLIGQLCQCQAEQKRAEKQAIEQQAGAQRLQRRRKELITNKLLLDCSFQGAVETDVIKKCRNYAQALCRGRVGNRGLLLWGGVGSGKTFAAACVANFAIDNGVVAKITSLPRVNGSNMDERRKFLDAMPGWGLLVLDDLSTERDTATANETTFQVINTRYESKKPMIITTNLSIEQLHHPENQHQARIYDRVLEVCTPLFCGETSMRKTAARNNLEKMRKILQGE